MAMRELNRKKAHREWLIRNLTTSLFLYERIETTEAKAKELRRFADRLIVRAQRGGLANLRYLRAWLADPLAAKKLGEVLVPRYQKRTSGFTRQVRLGNRVGDNAPLVMVELIPTPEQSTPKASSASKTAITAPATKRRLPSLRQPKAKVTVRRKGESQ